MVLVTAVLALLAAALHVFIWYLEAFAWTGRARAVFGNTETQAEQTREMAFNQGFYNLFLAIQAAVGAVALLAGHHTGGKALVFAGAGSMLAAALVLGLSSKPHRGAALKQGALPLLAVVAALFV